MIQKMPLALSQPEKKEEASRAHQRQVNGSAKDKRMRQASVPLKAPKVKTIEAPCALGTMFRSALVLRGNEDAQNMG
uniref:Single-stranded DNA-binding protein n=1 Tax=Panagrellus redivivus TaxID=6233 RepID=A0A7E4UM54_PANRE